jgi:MFS family permease
MAAPADPRSSDIEDLLPDLGISDALQQRPAGIGSIRHAIRIALAVTVSWMIARAVSGSSFSLFAPITTLLVVQTSPWTTLGVSVQRILGTGIGVLVASVYVNLVGLTWWSFLLGVLAALLIARLLPWSLGGQLQIPVAVVFVLALGAGSWEQDRWRLIDVVIGGLVGLVAVFVFPQRPNPEAFESAMRTYRDAVIDTVRSVGEESAAPHGLLGPDEVHAYVAPSRQLRERADAARKALVLLVEGAQLNMRAGGVATDLEERALRLRRLSGIAVQVRGIVGAANRLYDREGLVPMLTGAELDSIVRDLGSLMAAVLGAPGDVVGAGDPTMARDLDAALVARLHHTADEVVARRDRMGDVLASVSMLGRLDHVRGQLIDFPQWQA